MLGIGKKCLLITLALLMVLAIAGFAFPETKVKFTLDGKTRQVTTKADDVTGFLKEQNAAYKEQDFVFPPLSASLEEGIHIILEHATPITVELNGKKEKIFTLASTVGEAVEAAGIGLETADQITPGLDVQITKNTPITIAKATSSMDVCRTPVAYQTITQTDGSIPQGRAEVVQEGKEGVTIQFFDVRSMGGQEVERILKTERKICGPVDEIVKVGTKKIQRAKPKPVRLASAGSSVNVSRGGGGRVFKATAYSAGHGCGYTTATGGRAQRGVVAVDPRVIPLGTKLYVEGYGEAVAGDTGGAIKGNRVDLCFDSNADAVQFGRRDVVVHVQ